MKKAILVSAIFCVLAGPALARCPSLTAGSTAEEIRQNELRTACLLDEVSNEAQQRRQQLEYDVLSQRLRDLETQRRFDALDFTPPTPVYVPPPNLR